MHTHSSPRSAPGTRAVALAAAALATVAAALLLSGTPAHAATPLPEHVKIDGGATAGTSSAITFRVPTESDTASTISLKVVLPADEPITSVSPEFKPGWDVQVVKSDLNPPVTQGNVQIKSYVSAVIWTANDGGIPPEQYDTFTVQVAIPDAGTLSIPAYQGYSDGTNVAWADPANADGSEPAHPAPTVAVAPAAGDTTGAVAAPAADPSLGISVAALIVGALGLVAAVIAIVLRRRRA